MPKFNGYLFSRLAAIGTKSEGPVYFLQQFDYAEHQVIKKAPLWQEDPKLHRFLNRKVTIDGKMSYSGIEYNTVAPFTQTKALAAANQLKLELKLEHDPLWVDKQPGPRRPPQGTAFTLRVKWPYRSIWQGQCPTSQIFDFCVEYNGKPIWTWSEGRVFAQVVTPVTIPGGNWHEFSGAWKINPKTIKAEGAYTAKAVFIASGQEVKKSFKIKFAQ